MLRETLGNQMVPPPQEGSSGCLDPDRLAAWCDGTLSRRDRAIVESHAATCARCQAMLAAMARTATPAQAPRWWQTSTVRWLVPIATVSALAVAVWVNVPAERQAASMRQSDFRGRSAHPPVSEARPAQATGGAAKEQFTAPAAKAIDKLEAPADAKRAERGDAEAGQRRTPAESAAPSPASVQTAPSSVVQPEPANAPTFVARDASPSAVQQRDQAEPIQPPIQPPDQTASVQPPVQVAGRGGTLRSAASRALAETAAIAQRQRTAAESPARLEIPSPDLRVRWRIVAGSVVERSTDAGTTWQVQSTGATGRLTAGAAPSSTICWLVGTGGVVLVSRDGRTWQRVPFPEATDLAAILATDASNATATAADGRVFSTNDGGKTWRR
jgi:Putative zinc-finger